MKVDVINNYRLNNTIFEGRKNKETQKPVHVSSPVRAIPLAVLIAMSPLNTPVINAQHTIPENNKTLVEKKKHVHILNTKMPHRATLITAELTISAIRKTIQKAKEFSFYSIDHNQL